MEKYKFVFESAKKFLNEIIAKHNLDNAILKKHLESKSKFDDISNANLGLIKSLPNRNRMASVIGFDEKEKEMRRILFGYDPKKIIDRYNDAHELLKKFIDTFNLPVQSKRSLWRVFSRGIISGSTFMASFKDKNDFDNFVKSFSYDKYTKAALPMLLDEEIDGFGFTLSCDFLKELGYRDYPKPDIMLIDIFYGLGLSKSTKPYEVYKSIIEMVEVVGKDAYAVDKIFWLIGSGKLVGNKSIGSYRDKFIESTKLEMRKVFEKTRNRKKSTRGSTSCK